MRNALAVGPTLADEFHGGSPAVLRFIDKMEFSYTPHHRLLFGMGTLEHVDERPNPLAQADGGGRLGLVGVRLRMRLILVFWGVVPRRFFVFHGLFQRGPKLGHGLGLEDALGGWLAAQQFEQLVTLGAEHDEVAGGCGFE